MDEGPFRVILAGERFDGIAACEEAERVASLSPQPRDAIIDCSISTFSSHSHRTFATYAEKGRRQLHNIDVVTPIKQVPQVKQRRMRSNPTSRIAVIADSKFQRGIGIISHVVLSVLILPLIDQSLSRSPGVVSDPFLLRLVIERNMTES